MGIIILPVLPRILSPDAFGTYSIAFLTLTVASQAMNDWSRNSILRFESKHRSRPEYGAFLSSVLIPPVLLGVAAGVAAVVLWQLTDALRTFGTYVAACALVLPLLIIHTLLLTLLRVRQATLRFSTLQILERLGALGLGITFVIALGLSGAGLIWGVFATHLVLLPLCLKWTQVIPELSFRLVDSARIRTYLTYGMPLAVFALCMFLMRYADRYMISHFRSIHEVGLYSYASLYPQRTIEAIIGIMALGAFPVIVREWESRGISSATQITSGLARYHLLVNAPIIGLLLLFPKEILGFIGTQEYREAYRVIPLVTLGSYFASLAWFSSIAFHLSTRTGRLLRVSLIALMLNILLNLLSIPRWGYVGAAYTTLFSSIFYCAATFAMSRKSLPWGIGMGSILKTVAAAVVPGVLVLAARRVLPVRGLYSFAFMAVIYLGAYTLMLELQGEFAVTRAIRTLVSYSKRPGVSD